MYLSPNITIFFTIFAVAVSFAWLGVDDPSRWEAGAALYILGCECPGYSYAFVYLTERGAIWTSDHFPGNVFNSSVHAARTYLPWGYHSTAY